MLKTAQVQSFVAGSEELIEFVARDPGSLTRVFEREMNGVVGRFTVLTLASKELENLKEFGDVRFRRYVRTITTALGSCTHNWHQ